MLAQLGAYVALFRPMLACGVGGLGLVGRGLCVRVWGWWVGVGQWWFVLLGLGGWWVGGGPAWGYVGPAWGLCWCVEVGQWWVVLLGLGLVGWSWLVSGG